MKNESNQALLVVDVQNDFCPGGALAVREGDRVVPVVNSLLRRFSRVVFTQDWHPANHGSFASQHPGKKPGETIKLEGISQILWPQHCVQGTAGAEFHADLDFRLGEPVVRKGQDKKVDSYSGFFDNARRHDTGLHALLQTFGTKQLYVGGLATDYCVRFTTEDALQLGYEVFVVAPACRAVNLAPGDGEKALADLAARGAHIVQDLTKI